MPRRRWLRWLLSVYALLALFAYAPQRPGAPHTLVNCVCGDNVQAPWFLGYVLWAILSAHSPLVSTYVDFPRGVHLFTNTSEPLLRVATAQ